MRKVSLIFSFVFDVSKRSMYSSVLLRHGTTKLWLVWLWLHRVNTSSGGPTNNRPDYALCRINDAAAGPHARRTPAPPPPWPPTPLAVSLSVHRRRRRLHRRAPTQLPPSLPPRPQPPLFPSAPPPSRVPAAASLWLRSGVPCPRRMVPPRRNSLCFWRWRGESVRFPVFLCLVRVFLSDSRTFY